MHKKNVVTKIQLLKMASSYDVIVTWLLPYISNIFQRVREIFMKTPKVLYNLQFGFRKQFSTTHALLSIAENFPR